MVLLSQDHNVARLFLVAQRQRLCFIKRANKRASKIFFSFLCLGSYVVSKLPDVRISKYNHSKAFEMAMLCTDQCSVLVFHSLLLFLYCQWYSRIFFFTILVIISINQKSNTSYLILVCNKNQHANILILILNIICLTLLLLSC